MSTIQIFSRLIKLVFPLTGFMICAILMGVAGFLCAIFIPVLSSMALVNDPLFSFHTIVILLFVCALLRGILRYAEQACNHYIAFKLLARIRDQVFGALRKLCPAKLEVKDKGIVGSVLRTYDFSNLYCVCHKSNLCGYSSAVWMDLWTLFTFCLRCCGSGFTNLYFQTI